MTRWREDYARNRGATWLPATPSSPVTSRKAVISFPQRSACRRVVALSQARPDKRAHGSDHPRISTKNKIPLKNILDAIQTASECGGSDVRVICTAESIHAKFRAKADPGIIGTQDGALIAIEDLRLWSERHSLCIGHVIINRSAGCLICFLE